MNRTTSGCLTRASAIASIRSCFIAAAGSYTFAQFRIFSATGHDRA